MMSDAALGEAAQVPARSFRAPAFLSEGARQFLMQQPEPAALPAIQDKAAWQEHIATMDQAVVPFLTQICAAIPADVTELRFGSARVFDVIPAGLSLDSRGVILDMHGGGLIMCGGELCRLMAIGLAARLQRRIWSIDYRMPPQHPYPAALDDCIAAYRAVLGERRPEEIVIHGGSAGGNLAAATILRARDEGLPVPAGAILNTPEADLTESGDSFQTNLGVDPGLRSLMPANLLYANGHPLEHPYLSPLFGDFEKGFPPTLLTSGTRDLYLSNTVRLHRALRAADIPAELHLTEAGPHTGFPGTPEGNQIDRELHRFLQTLWPRG
jgi:monoterpene epsilon-lactone hydrolase